MKRTTSDGPEVRLFWPGTDETTHSYLPDAAIRSEAHADALAKLEMDHQDLRLDGAAKALRIGGDGLDRGLPTAYGYLFTYRTKRRGAS